MNYFENYKNFYSGKNRREMFMTFCKLIEGIRDNDINKLSEILTDDCIADISMNGHHFGKTAVINALLWPGPKMDLYRITFNSFISRSHNNIGQQCAYTQHLYSIIDGDNVYPFIFGGQFCNSYVYENSHWLINHIRFDLMFESGNNSYVKDKWKLMDYSIFFGHKPMINVELESPWIAIPHDDEPLSNAEQIFELEYRNNIGMDGGAFNLSHEIFSDSVFLNYSSHQNVNKNYSTSSDGDYYGRKAASNFFKSKQHKEARLQHIVTMAELEIDDDCATAYMIRSEYNRIKNNIYNKHTIHCQPLTAVHAIKAIRENGVWKMKEMSYFPIMEFMPIDDDCIVYDELICGDSMWKNIKNKFIIHS
ncbi:MAG: hypothetical protein ACLRZ9_01010 [Eubacterium sp.]